METQFVNNSDDKKQYETPEIDVLVLKNEGIICSSVCANIGCD